MIEAIVVVLLVGLDQFTKHLTDLYLMPLGTSVPLWEGVFHFTSAHNTGAAFSIFSGGRWVFIVLTILACGLICFFLIKKHKKLHMLLRIALAMVLAGAIGNLIDRAMLAYVRDMIEFRFIHFAIFNVADSCVTVGAILLFCDVLFGKGQHLFTGKPGKGRESIAAEQEERQQDAIQPNEQPDQMGDTRGAD